MRGTVRWRNGAWRIQVYAGRVAGRERRIQRTVRAPNTRRGRARAEAALLQEQFGQTQAAMREHTDAVGQELDGIRQLATDAEPGATGATTAPPASTEATAPAASADPGQAAAPATPPAPPEGSDGPQRP